MSIFKTLQGLGVKSFGAPLYDEVAVVATIPAGEYNFNSEYNQIELEEDGVKMYIPVRRTASVDGTQDITLANFRATRTEEGIFNGTAWTVQQGSEKVFAY